MVRDHTQPGASLRAHPFAANKHHRGGWVYVHGFLPYGEAEVRAMVVEALDDLDEADSETLATWVYVNGELAGAQVLSILEEAETS